jgi:dihydroflavonol-4-reductase
VVHAAAHLHIGSTQLEQSRAINVRGTQHIAAAARDEGIRLVYVSTVDTLGVGARGQLATESRQFGAKASSSYVISKREAEQSVTQAVRHGLDAVILHPCFTLGPWDWKPSSARMLLAVAQRFTPLAPTGGHTVADVRDVAEGIRSARERGRTGEHYILGGHPMTYLDFWRLCAEVSGGKPPWFRAGPLMRIIGGRAGDVWGTISGREPDLNSAAIRMSSQFHYYSSDKAQQELDYRTRPVRETVEAAWQWLREYGYVG